MGHIAIIIVKYMSLLGDLTRSYMASLNIHSINILVVLFLDNYFLSFPFFFRLGITSYILVITFVLLRAKKAWYKKQEP